MGHSQANTSGTRRYLSNVKQLRLSREAILHGNQRDDSLDKAEMMTPQKRS